MAKVGHCEGYCRMVSMDKVVIVVKFNVSCRTFTVSFRMMR